MESLFCLQQKFFRMQMSQTVTRQRLLMTFLDSLFNFCMSCSVGRSKGIPTSSGSWHNGTGFYYGCAESSPSTRTSNKALLGLGRVRVLIDTRPSIKPLSFWPFFLLFIRIWVEIRPSTDVMTFSFALHLILSSCFNVVDTGWPKKKTGPNSNYSKYTGPVFLGHPVLGLGLGLGRVMSWILVTRRVRVIFLEAHP